MAENYGLGFIWISFDVPSSQIFGVVNWMRWLSYRLPNMLNHPHVGLGRCKEFDAGGNHCRVVSIRLKKGGSPGKNRTDTLLCRMFLKIERQTGG